MRDPNRRGDRLDGRVRITRVVVIDREQVGGDVRLEWSWADRPRKPVGGAPEGAHLPADFVDERIDVLAEGAVVVALEQLQRVTQVIRRLAMIGKLLDQRQTRKVDEPELVDVAGRDDVADCIDEPLKVPAPRPE